MHYKVFLVQLDIKKPLYILGSSSANIVSCNLIFQNRRGVNNILITEYIINVFGQS